MQITGRKAFWTKATARGLLGSSRNSKDVSVTGSHKARESGERGDREKMSFGEVIWGSSPSCTFPFLIL